MKKCIYCNVEIDNDSVVDVCTKCGVGVWGPKMFKAILENMNSARQSGDLYQGSVTEQPKSETPRRSGLSSIAQEAIETQESAPVERQVDKGNLPEPTSDDIPPLVDSFPEPQKPKESLGPESEISPRPSESESASAIVNNVNNGF